MKGMDALCCVGCGEVIIKSVDGVMKVRSKVLVVPDGGVVKAVCKGCSMEVPVPLKPDMSLMKSNVFTRKLRLYVNK